MYLRNIRLKLSTVTVCFLIPFLCFSHNGKIAYAYPVDHLKIDGSLHDWPRSFLRYNIGDPAYVDKKINYESFFIIGYNLEEQALYIGLQVQDNINIPGISEGNIWGRVRDQHLLYIDPEHNKGQGSGIVMLFGSQTGVDLWKVENNWDPFNKQFTEHNVQLKVKRNKDKTTYEWKIFLGTSVTLNKSIGLDHVLQDADDNGNTANYNWGPGGVKNRVPSRLGDIVFVKEKTKLHNVKGAVAWSKPVNENYPSGLKIVSALNNQFWCQVTVDTTGGYSAILPEGTYRISPASKTTNNSGLKDIRRINEESSVLVRVDKPLVVSDTLKIGWYTKPEFLIPQEGLLLYYDESKSGLVDIFIETYRQYYNIPGLSVALVKDGKIVYAKAFGVKNTITNEPVSLKTIFETASISKAVFAFAVNRLAEKRVIDLGKPLNEYLVFENIADDERSKLITARMVLSHQTGLPNWAWGGPSNWKKGRTTRLLFTPGTRFEYSGEGYEYLGRVIEKVTGKSIDAVMQEEVYAVMNMKETALTATEALKDRIGIGHTSDLPMVFSLESKPWVAGSMYSTTEDLANYMTGLMSGTGLSKEGYQKMFTPQIENKSPFIQYFGGDRTFHCLGFEFQQSPYGNFIHHGGNNGDYQGRWAMNLEQKVGYVILTNNDAGFYMDLDFQAFLITGRNTNRKISK